MPQSSVLLVTEQFVAHISSSRALRYLNPRDNRPASGCNLTQWLPKRGTPIRCFTLRMVKAPELLSYVLRTRHATHHLKGQSVLLLLFYFWIWYESFIHVCTEIIESLMRHVVFFPVWTTDLTHVFTNSKNHSWLQYSCMFRHVKEKKSDGRSFCLCMQSS